MTAALFAAALTAVGVGIDRVRTDNEKFGLYRTEIDKQLDGVPNSSELGTISGLNVESVPRIDLATPNMPRDEFLESQSQRNTSATVYGPFRPYIKRRKAKYMHKREVKNPFGPQVGQVRDHQVHISRNKQIDRIHVKRTDLVDMSGNLVQSESTGVEVVIPQGKTERLRMEQARSRTDDAYRTSIPNQRKSVSVDHNRITFSNTYQNQGSTARNTGEVFVNKKIDWWDWQPRAILNSIHENVGARPQNITRKNRDYTKNAWVPVGKGQWTERRPRIESFVQHTRRGDYVMDARRPNATLESHRRVLGSTVVNKNNIRSQNKRHNTIRSTRPIPANPATRNARPKYIQENTRYKDNTIEHGYANTHNAWYTQRQTYLEDVRKPGVKVLATARSEKFGGASKPVMVSRIHVPNQTRNESSMNPYQ